MKMCEADIQTATGEWRPCPNPAEVVIALVGEPDLPDAALCRQHHLPTVMWLIQEGKPFAAVKIFDPSMN